MVGPVIVCEDFLELLFTLSPDDEAVPPLKVMAGFLEDVHALHGLASVYAVLSTDNP